MTAIYALAEPEARRALLGADDVDSHGNRHNKVEIAGRFGVAAFGPEMGLEAVRDVKKSQPLAGLVQLVRALGIAVQNVAAETESEYRAKLLGDVAALRRMDQSVLEMLLLDTETCRLHHVSFGMPYGPGRTVVDPPTTALVDGVLHRFSFAEAAEGVRTAHLAFPSGPGPTRGPEEPGEWSLAAVAAFVRHHLDLDRPLAAEAGHLIGHLGAVLVSVDGRLERLPIDP